MDRRSFLKATAAVAAIAAIPASLVTEPDTKNHRSIERYSQGFWWPCTWPGLLEDDIFRLRDPDGSIVDLVCRLRKKATRADVNGVVKEAAEGPMKKVVEYSEAPLVSSDIIGNTHSSIFDSISTSSQKDGYLKIISWYDNEWGYSNRVVDLIEKLVTVGE